MQYIRKYFDSIDHETLKNLLTKIITDTAARNLFFAIIDSADVLLDSHKGIPIGNLTSQYFANYYLSAFDHCFKEQFHMKRYVRYMDDILVFSSSKSELCEIYKTAVIYTDEKLKLELKPSILGTAEDGAPFLGFRIKPSGIFLQQKTKKRYKTKITEIEFKRKTGQFSELEAGRRVESVTAHLLIARSFNFRNTVVSGRVFGV